MGRGIRRGRLFGGIGMIIELCIMEILIYILLLLRHPFSPL